MNRRTFVRTAVAAPAAALLADAAPTPKPEAERSLVLVEEVPNKEGTVDRRRLVRVRVRGGAVGRPETVWEGGQRFLGHFGGHRVVAGRYVVTKFGGVFDLVTKAVVHAEESGDVIAADGNRVLYWMTNARRPEGVFAFDLGTRAVSKVANLGDAMYIGVRSPDRTKAVVTAGLDELTLVRAGSDKGVSLGKGFRAQVGPLSSTLPRPPVLWLDDDRVLSQTANGVLVSVALDGTRAPVVTLPARADLGTGPTLSRDPSGRIIYRCGDDGWAVDPVAKTGTAREWVDLGHGFDAGWYPEKAGGHTFRREGKRLGAVACHPHAPNDVATAADHIAVVVQPARGPRASKEVRVWSAAAGGWAAVTLLPNSLVGWVW